ncbi:MAG: hypothetical protein ACRC0A_00835 [Chitinophagaceae bacterium]
MQINDIHQQIGNMKVDDNTKNAIINLIDLKTESDMEKILQRMDSSNKILGKKSVALKEVFLNKYK